jgi:predicted transcriptional regulator
MTKTDIIKAMEALPEDASIEDAMDRLVYLDKIERGLQQAKAGQTITQEEAKARMAKMLA